jgi:anthranilate phosphoribosyltransferase
MKVILNQLFEHRKLTREQSREVLINISQENYNPSQVAAFISVYLMRNISVEELTGFRDALLELCIPLDINGIDSIDVCGTGGDGKNTFNISTSSAFVIAGAGYKVVKHGNYGVSSLCGSSNVLEHLGIEFTNKSDILKKELDEANICFLHAPLFHPALKSVGPIRRQLGVKTFFNMLGPLVNPAQPNHQMVGVFNLKLARLYQYLHQKLDKKFSIVHSIDGYDEISLTGATKLISNEEEKLVQPSYFGQRTLQPEDIFGGNSIQEASEIFVNVLSGKGSPAQEAVVLANSASAIQCFENSKSIDECIIIAKESIQSGNALTSLKKLIN